jgi:hypothetical protein
VESSNRKMMEKESWYRQECFAPRRDQGAKSVGILGSTTTSVYPGIRTISTLPRHARVNTNVILSLRQRSAILSLFHWKMTYILSYPKTVRLFALLSLMRCISGQALQGCAAVNCPNRYENMLSPTCQVEQTDMRLIGLLSTNSKLLSSDITWIIGDSGLQTTIQGNERTVTRSFYVGTPESVNLAAPDLSIRGCAFFVISPDTGAYQVYDQGAPQYVNTASCAGSMGETCVKDMTSKVERLARSVSAISTNIFCNSIAEELQKDPPSSCYILTQRPRIQAIALTGPGAPQPILPSENGTSNCWPTLPKSNNLTKVFEYDHLAQLTEWVPWLGYTPLITVFSPGYATGDVEVDLQCMTIVDSDDLSDGTARNGTDVTVVEGGTVGRKGGWGVFVVIGFWLVLLV